MATCSDRAPAFLSAVAAVTLAVAPPAVVRSAAATFVSPAQALAEAFPGARIERRSVALTPERAKAVEQRAQARLVSALVTPYLAFHGDTLAGVAIFESRTIRTQPATLMVVVAPDSTVRRVEILSFQEPPDYRPSPRWLDRMSGHRADDRFRPGRDLPALSGATLSARAVTESARLAVAIFERVVAPTLGPPASGAAQSPGGDR